MLSIFSCVCLPSVCLWRNACLFVLVLSSMNCLCILEINTLSVASFGNTFSYSEDCLFILFAKRLGVEFDLEEYCD